MQIKHITTEVNCCVVSNKCRDKIRQLTGMKVVPLLATQINIFLWCDMKCTKLNPANSSRYKQQTIYPSTPIKNIKSKKMHVTQLAKSVLRFCLTS